MARNTMEAWVPEEDGSTVLQRVNQLSGIERFARREPMNTDTKNVPRSAGVGVESIGKGGAYGEDESVNDAVTLVARKFGKAIRIAEEDLDDTLVDVIASKQRDWATSYAKFVDNAALGVTAASNGTTVPFTSVYRALTQSNGDTGYTANDNLEQSAGAVTYDLLSTTLGHVEDSDYFDDGSIVVIAHPQFRGAFRGIKDDQNMPVFIQGLAGTPDTLFGYPVAWSSGTKTSATATAAPDGNPLLVVANRDYLILGVRSGPESVFIDGTRGLSALTDEAILKMRARRGFAVGHEHAFAALEITAGGGG